MHTELRGLLETQPRSSLLANHLIIMANSARCIIALLVILGIAYQALGVVEDSERNIMGINFPYGRGLDNELQLARLLLLPPRLYHPKRNSELINSLLGLPKNINNAGK